MRHPQIPKKEMGLIKGAIRRAFSRSELRKQAINMSVIQHSDPSRPRVTKWSQCRMCASKVPTYLIEIDHREPVVPLNIAFENCSMDVIIDRMWCDVSNLSALCEVCHKTKSKGEAAARASHRKLLKGANNVKSRRKQTGKVRNNLRNLHTPRRIGVFRNSRGFKS